MKQTKVPSDLPVTERLRVGFDHEKGKFFLFQDPSDADLPDVHWFFKPIDYGFQLSDGTDSDDRDTMWCETTYTVLVSPSQAGRAEVMILYTSVDGGMKVIGKGSVPYEEPEADGRLLQWIETHINREFDNNAKRRAEARDATARAIGELVGLKPNQAEPDLAQLLGQALAHAPKELLLRCLKSVSAERTE